MRHNFKPYLNPIFIETGSLHGKGIEAARQAGFGKIISIELSKEHWRYCRKLFTGDGRVSLYHGDSVKLLPLILACIDDKCTFWLDAHFSGDDTAQGPCSSPVLQEIEIINNHHIKGHTIIIDDMRLFRNPPPEWDLDFNDKDIEKALEGYELHYENGITPNDILIAQ